MIKKIMSVILTVVMSLSLCTVAFAVDVLEDNYEIFMLPVISDKLPTENQITEIKVYLDKQTDTAFVALEDVCELIGASCSQEDDIYAVQRDAVYFSYNGQGNMELYLLTENSTSVFLDAVAQATGNIIRKNIIGHRLLDGDLFESRKISNQWYVDYIKFCDMFGVKLSKYTSNNHNNLLAIIQELNISLSHDVKFNFDKNPYYVKMYSGTTLSSIYQKVMRNYETYLFDYYALKTKNSDFWDDVTQKLSTMCQLADLQYKNVLSNVINDWNGFTSALLDQYEPGEHYTESLLNILNSNYLEYVIKNSSSNNELPNTFSDFIESFEVFYGSLLEKESNLLSASENVKNFVDYFQALSQNNGDYAKVFQSMAESADSIVDEVFSGLSVAKIMINSVSAFIELNDTCRQINDLSSDKMTFLQKGIFENEKLVAESSKVNISGIMDKISQTANILYPTGVFSNMSGNYVRKALQNSDNNAKGVIDSARKIYDTYGNVGEQNLEKLKEVLKTAVYTELDEGTQMVLSKFPETVPVAIAMSVIDGSMALAKSDIGEELKDAENLIQYYYIEQNLLCNLNEWNPEKLHSNLTFALMASLCCYENHKKVMENAFKELENKEINLPEDYFQRVEAQRKELDDSINKIAETLYQLDHQKTQLCIDYYHDPRNNNVSADIVEAILNYNNGTISGRVITDNNQPIEKAKISVFVFANGIGIGSEEDVYYTDDDGKFSIPVSARNEYMLQVTCDGYKSADDNEFVKIYPVVVEQQKTTHINDIFLSPIFDLEKYKPYLPIIDDLLKKYGVGQVIESNFYDTERWCLNGLGYADLLDMDNDGTLELVCIYCKDLDTISKDKTSICKVDIYGISNEKAVKIYSGNVPGQGYFENGRPFKYLIKNGNIFVQTKKDIYTYINEEWAKVEERKLITVDILSNFNDINSPTINGLVVDQATFNKKLQEYSNAITIFCRYDKNTLLNELAITEKTLSLFGFDLSKYNQPEDTSKGFWREVVVKNGTTAAIANNGDLYMWGWNGEGNIGNVIEYKQLTPTKILSNVKSIDIDIKNIGIDGSMSSAVTNDGDFYVWGWASRNNEKDKAKYTTPLKVMNNVKTMVDCNHIITYNNDFYEYRSNNLQCVKILSNVKTASCGYNSSAAITNDGDLYVWGKNNHGQVGNGTTIDQATPVKILSDVKSIYLSFSHSSAITNDGDLYVWGANSYGQVGNGTTIDQTTPVKVLSNVKSCHLSSFFSSAITNDNKLYIWGVKLSNSEEMGKQLKPQKVLDNTQYFTSITSDNAAITNNGDLCIWGSYYSGTVGDEKQITPIKILSNVKNIILDTGSGIAITDNDDLYMWESNNTGKNGTTELQITPIKILSDVKHFSGDSSSFAVITANGELYMWGDNLLGTIGNGTTENQLTPYKVTVE